MFEFVKYLTQNWVKTTQHLLEHPFIWRRAHLLRWNLNYED